MNWKRRILCAGFGFAAGMVLWVITGGWLLWRHPPYHIPGPTGTNYRRWPADAAPRTNGLHGPIPSSILDSGGVYVFTNRLDRLSESPTGSLSGGGHPEATRK